MRAIMCDLKGKITECIMICHNEMDLNISKFANHGSVFIQCISLLGDFNQLGLSPNHKINVAQ